MSNAEVVATMLGPARLRRSRRKTLAITVQPDGSIELTAPAHARLKDILLKVIKRAAWIRRQQREFAVMNGKRPTRRYTSGATVRYLGRQYRLKVSRGAARNVKLAGAFFHVITRHGGEAEVEELLTCWMRERALDQLARRLKGWEGWCQRHRLPTPCVHLRKMPKRWGSAQRDGRIWFNPELVRAPSICIDYVVAHEVCHLRHPNHGPEFFRQLDHLFPNWRSIKTRLECIEL
jgi:predicted metal-dependent hydrolase